MAAGVPEAGQGTMTTAAPPKASKATGLDQNVLPARALMALARICSRRRRLDGCTPPCMLGKLPRQVPGQSFQGTVRAQAKWGHALTLLTSYRLEVGAYAISTEF